MAQPEFDLLIAIIESQAKFLAVKALVDATTADQFCLKLDAANESLRKAQLARHTSEMLTKLSQQSEPYTLVSIK